GHGGGCGKATLALDVERAALASAEAHEPAVPCLEPQLPSPAQDPEIRRVVVGGSHPRRRRGPCDDSLDRAEIRSVVPRSCHECPTAPRVGCHALRCERASASCCSRSCAFTPVDGATRDQLPSACSSQAS